MSEAAKNAADTARVRLSPKDLPAHCPGDNSALWCTHPKVFVALSNEDGDTWRCPYCGTIFEMVNPGS